MACLSSGSINISRPIVRAILAFSSVIVVDAAATGTAVATVAVPTAIVNADLFPIFVPFVLLT